MNSMDYNYELLRRFCVQAESPRYAINFPFRDKEYPGYWFATDTHIAICMPDSMLPADIETHPDRRLPRVRGIVGPDVTKNADYDVAIDLHSGVYMTCPICHGVGKDLTDEGECDICKGNGEIECETCNNMYECRCCAGTGRLGRPIPCKRCEGIGKVELVAVKSNRAGISYFYAPDYIALATLATRGEKIGLHPEDDSPRRSRPVCFSGDGVHVTLMNYQISGKTTVTITTTTTVTEAPE